MPVPGKVVKDERWSEPWSCHGLARANSRNSGVYAEISRVVFNRVQVLVRESVLAVSLPRQGEEEKETTRRRAARRAA